MMPVERRGMVMNGVKSMRPGGERIVANDGSSNAADALACSVATTHLLTLPTLHTRGTHICVKSDALHRGATRTRGRLPLRYVVVLPLCHTFCTAAYFGLYTCIYAWSRCLYGATRAWSVTAPCCYVFGMSLYLWWYAFIYCYTGD
jgi:hypothetical protein